MKMKKYVGIAKMKPDSFTPRRLPAAMMAMNASEIGTDHELSEGTSETRAAVPAATDTATVRM